MKKTKSDYVYVGVQVLLFALYMIPVSALSFSNHIILSVLGMLLLVLGIVMGFISMLQLNTNLTPFPTPVSGSKLIEVGFYKYIRHPIYTSILMVLFGYGMHEASGYKLLVTLALLLLFFFKSTYEEQKLSIRFPKYVDYKKRTGRFFPKLFSN
ncbi:protein-S-isoprenylcysteine O-methyltransferase Ste14 [Kordia periserrulae]|uniref:Protein-S-isoprenylcysteine O-methyltransferase Ste14 n=1 Tax=Kordia periserrulae TaxID=701523 RepID=A0A2T6BUP5_9FLAO|nr:methyltransferase [Kordia periserrulae]PTX59766.1 protein-S-isoprenylcysteine O-methyltransferase Ste14 [Kordia periserrulae]